MRDGERHAPPLVMGALTALFLMAVTTAILAAGYRNQFFRLRHVIYQQCLQRDAYDRASQQARAAQIRWLEDQVAAERTNRFIDERLRAQRITSAQRAIDGLNRALSVGAPTGCNAYN